MEKRRNVQIGAAAALAVCLLAGCSQVTEEMQAARMEGIAQMESGDYDKAIESFDLLIDKAGSVTEFELDVLKYRAEAEFLTGDYEAAAYTYEILEQVDEPKAEYCYFEALNLAKSGNAEEAKKKISEGKGLDKNLKAAGFPEAMEALAGALLEAGDKGGADEVCLELIASGQAGAETYNRLMLHAMESGDYEKALSYAAEGLALADESVKADLKFNEAVCYEYMGQYGKALELFRSYTAEFGNDEKAEHEIAFLVTR